MPSPVTEERVGVRVTALLMDVAPALAWGTAAGISIIAYYVLRGLFSFTETAVGTLFGWIPGVNKFVQKELTAAEHKLTHWCGQAAASCEARMGDYFHAAGNQIASIGHEIFGEAVATWQIAQWLYKVSADVLTGEAWQEIFHNDITALYGSNAAQQRKLARQQKAIDHAQNNPIGAGVKTATKPTTVTANHTATLTLPGLREWVKEREADLEKEQAATKARVGTLEKEYLRVSDWVKAKERLFGALAITGTVTWVLARTGAGWLRCSNWSDPKRGLGRTICRMPFHWLDDVLGLLADFVVLENICRVLPWLEAGASDVASPLIGTLTKAGAGLCHGRKGPAAPLQTPALYLAGTGGTPTLHLP